jgi:hypothetical protein
LLLFIRHLRNNKDLAFSGLSKGLTIVLDAHNDISAASSVDVDEQGFIGTVTSSGSFPLTFQDGFQIKPGHTNMVIIFTLDHYSDCFLHVAMPLSHSKKYKGRVRCTVQ